jgi:patatin-like phospholipase/acyl hydrolase
MKLNALVIDGGGSRGTIVVEQLCRMETLLGKRLQDHFDLFSGTSTGGIIAVMLSVGYSPEEIKQLYLQHGAKIFDKKLLRTVIFRSKYDDKYFNDVLSKYLGNKTLLHCDNQVIIPAYNATTMDRHIFKSIHKKQTQNYRLYDVVRSTASAPTYFDPHIINGQVYVDGGLVINNPSFVVFIEALKLGFVPGKDEINILSFGTGREEKPVSESSLKGGLAKNAKTLFDICLNEQVQTTDYYLRTMYEHMNIGKYERCESQIIHSNGKIDDFSKENTLNMVKDGVVTFEINKGQIQSFLS